MSIENEAQTMKRVIYVVDVGSPTGGMAWARLEDDSTAIPTGSADFERAASRIAEDLRSGAAVAIGFEAPGCVPVPVDVVMLGKARTGEVRAGISRPWSYGAGAYVTTMAIQLSAWLLRSVRAQVGEEALPRLTLDPASWTQSANVLLWEAFVSGPGHARAPNAHGVSEHIQDAATAAAAFRAWWSTLPRSPTAISCDPGIATFGATALWAGWTTDIGMLSQEPLVLWPDQPLGVNVVLDAPSSANVAPESGGAPGAKTPNEAVDAMDEGPPASAAILSLACGDSHSFWRNHQIATQITDFDLLNSLVGASPSQARQCEVSFDGGTTWQSLVLRAAATNQICWRGHNVRASVASKVAALVRT
jgi:hypothetical protein